MNRAHYVDGTLGSLYLGAALLPYQVTLGISLRWFERRPHLRLYVGPFKLYVGWAGA